MLGVGLLEEVLQVSKKYCRSFADSTHATPDVHAGFGDARIVFAVYIPVIFFSLPILVPLRARRALLAEPAARESHAVAPRNAARTRAWSIVASRHWLLAR